MCCKRASTRGSTARCCCVDSGVHLPRQLLAQERPARCPNFASLSFSLSVVSVTDVPVDSRARKNRPAPSSRRSPPSTLRRLVDPRSAATLGAHTGASAATSAAAGVSALAPHLASSALAGPPLRARAAAVSPDLGAPRAVDRAGAGAPHQLQRAGGRAARRAPGGYAQRGARDGWQLRATSARCRAGRGVDNCSAVIARAAQLHSHQRPYRAPPIVLRHLLDEIYDVDDGPMLRKRKLVTVTQILICLGLTAISIRRARILLVLVPFFLSAGVLGYLGADSASRRTSRRTSWGRAGWRRLLPLHPRRVVPQALGLRPVLLRDQLPERPLHARHRRLLDLAVLRPPALPEAARRERADGRAVRAHRRAHRRLGGELRVRRGGRAAAREQPDAQERPALPDLARGDARPRHRRRRPLIRARGDHPLARRAPAADRPASRIALFQPRLRSEVADENPPLEGMRRQRRSAVLVLPAGTEDAARARAARSSRGAQSSWECAARHRPSASSHRRSRRAARPRRAIVVERSRAESCSMHRANSSSLSAQTACSALLNAVVIIHQVPVACRAAFILVETVTSRRDGGIRGRPRWAIADTGLDLPRHPRRVVPRARRWWAGARSSSRRASRTTSSPTARRRLLLGPRVARLAPRLEQRSSPRREAGAILAAAHRRRR